MYNVTYIYLLYASFAISSSLPSSAIEAANTAVATVRAEQNDKLTSLVFLASALWLLLGALYVYVPGGARILQKHVGARI